VDLSDLSLPVDFSDRYLMDLSDLLLVWISAIYRCPVDLSDLLLPVDLSNLSLPVDFLAAVASVCPKVQ
jgi:hypothetical protein